MKAPIIDWIQPIFPAFCLTLMLITAYGGDWITTLIFLFVAWLDVYLTGEQEKALPRRTYLGDFTEWQGLS